MPDIDMINDLCREIAEETMEDNVESLVDAIEEEELDNMMLALGPRAFGPDAGSDDSGGLFYWDLK
jgi:hypothetical protein